MDWWVFELSQIMFGHPVVVKKRGKPLGMSSQVVFFRPWFAALLPLYLLLSTVSVSSTYLLYVVVSCSVRPWEQKAQTNRTSSISIISPSLFVPKMTYDFLARANYCIFEKEVFFPCCLPIYWLVLLIIQKYS